MVDYSAGNMLTQAGLDGAVAEAEARIQESVTSSVAAMEQKVKDEVNAHCGRSITEMQGLLAGQRTVRDEVEQKLNEFVTKMKDLDDAKEKQELLQITVKQQIERIEVLMKQVKDRKENENAKKCKEM